MTPPRTPDEVRAAFADTLGVDLAAQTASVEIALAVTSLVEPLLAAGRGHALDLLAEHLGPLRTLLAEQLGVREAAVERISATLLRNVGAAYLAVADECEQRAEELDPPPEEAP